MAEDDKRPVSRPKSLPTRERLTRAEFRNQQAKIDEMQVEEQSAIQNVGVDRWSWQNGILSESIKQNLLAYGWVSHPNCRDVKLVFPEEAECIGFQIWLDPRDLRSYVRRKRLAIRLAKSTWLPVRWLLVKYLERHLNEDIDLTLRRMVRDYLGDKVKINVEVFQWVGN